MTAILSLAGMVWAARPSGGGRRTRPRGAIRRMRARRVHDAPDLVQEGVEGVVVAPPDLVEHTRDV